ncbi:probable transmembrane ascorbate ferrireductase 4 isoform X1 [Gossypium hirsutum]|uniref:Probable transmembrane ascorbate ferrireductase 4 isoform X1 n=1 Tax=Gossypium hirsutum TaxID=3635 RepID=A0ABM2Z8U7_GOSHI|nr:probable transmembrane ascorbate ferrireductase 4 isoform X1 [Gossypium hirsutum]
MFLNKPMAAVSPPLVPPLLFARISGILVAALVLSWALLFKSSFLPHSSLPSQEDLIYAVLHPLLMVIGFILISGEGKSENEVKIDYSFFQTIESSSFFSAILIHRWLPGSRNLKKSVHLCLQGVALGCGVFGIWTKFHGQDGIVANFFSLHSWMGLICVSLFGAQWLVGFVSFWHRGEVRTIRAKVLPWHIFLGLYTYGLAVATAETGLLEKSTFLQSRRTVSKHCPESMIVNSLGLGLVLLCGIVILTAVSPKYHALQTKLMYSSDAKCLSS